ncbi:MAG: MFS transporter [bacterium]|nr:MFS transporter [bacterium]
MLAEKEDAGPGGIEVKKQPKSFYMIFFMEFWERFGFYVMNTVIIYFYFVKHLGFTEVHAFNIFGAFTGFLWGFMIFGGYIGDKFFGTKRTLIFGAVVLFCGYFFLAFSDLNTVYIALGLIAAGEGLFKANPASLLSKCYEDNDNRLHTAYTYYYMAINIGALIATFAAPALAVAFSWRIAFIFSALGMILALSNFIIYKKAIKHVGSEPDKQPFNFMKLIVMIVITVVLTYLAAYMLKRMDLVYPFFYVICIVALILYFVFVTKISNTLARKKMLVAFVLLIEGAWFNVLYQQMYTSVNFFAIKNSFPSFLGIHMSQVSFQGFDSIIIILFSPLFAMWFINNARKGKSLKITTKFTIGFFCCSIAFFILWLSTHFANSQGMLSSLWIFLFYIFQGTGEILISALGLAMIAELIHKRYTGFVYGFYFLTIAIGSMIGSRLADFSVPSKHITTAIGALPVYGKFFLYVGILSTIIAVIIAIVKPFLDKYIKEEEVKL